MNKFVGKMVGDGHRKAFDFQHELNTTDFVFDVRDVDGSHGQIVSLNSVGDYVVQVTTMEPLKDGECLWITLIG